jgi:hypothetical protein
MNVSYDNGMIVFSEVAVSYSDGMIVYREAGAGGGGGDPPAPAIVGDREYEKLYPPNQTRDFPVHIPWTRFPHE